MAKVAMLVDVLNQAIKLPNNNHHLLPAEMASTEKLFGCNYEEHVLSSMPKTYMGGARL